MNWARLRAALDRWRHPVRLPPSSAARLAAWRARPAGDSRLPFEAARYVVVDVESTGLDLHRDRLLAIGAVAVSGGRIDLVDHFEVVLKQDQASAKDNILVHGIGGESQRTGTPADEALLAFLEFLGDDPLVAFHVAFDETMLRRACRTALGLDFRHRWVDLAYLLPALLPEPGNRLRSLDDWAGHFALRNHARHNALADALATAHLLLRVLPLASARRARHFQGLADLEQAQRWVKWAS